MSNRSTIITMITHVLIVITLTQSLKLFALPTQQTFHITQAYWHVLNMLGHTMLFMAVLWLLNINRVNAARYALLLSFFSYIVSASILWQFDVNLQFYFLLSMFVTCYIFDHHEKYPLFMLIGLQITCFLILNFYLVPIHNAPATLDAKALLFYQRILFINTFVFAIACVCCALFIRAILTTNWSALRRLEQNQTQLLKKIFPEQLMPSLLQSSDLNDEMQNNEYLGVIFLDICDFTRLSIDKKTERLDWQNTYKLYAKFDAHLSYLDAKRIKTNGDQYILLVGLHSVNRAKKVNDKIAKQTIEACQILRKSSHIDVKIGAAFGLVTYGVFDATHPNFDLWGETVIRAARLESIAKKNEVCIDQSLAFSHKDKMFTKAIKMELKGLGSHLVSYL